MSTDKSKNAHEQKLAYDQFSLKTRVETFANELIMLGYAFYTHKHIYKHIYTYTHTHTHIHTHTYTHTQTQTHITQI
jgi:hypothetical protein